MDHKTIQLTLPMSSLPTGNRRAGSLRVKEGVKEALKQALDRCGLDRETVADELSRLVGEPVSVHTVNNWVADAKGDRRFPLEYAGALTAITGDVGFLQAALAGGAGIKVLAPEEVAYYELGKITAEERARRKRKRAVLEKIGA